jgi:hypothetical protein
MAAPPAYLDECIDRLVADDLRRRGFDVLTALEAGRSHYSDPAQLQYATSVGHVLVTFNRMDFRRIHLASVQTGRPHGGIIILPQTRNIPRRQILAALLLEWCGITVSSHSHLMVWNDLQQQLIRGCRIDGYTDDHVRVALAEA